ncbi:tripartite tricarboxylate transporter TctB family protein [Microbacterium sp. BWT-B31]|uniref:tripartite tricarboxylate transporter TctB family protein n=1 Tax=Microbacterium sp. BWT-B31 TaxID=3232072 RepID=UPI00352819CB
MSTEAIHTANDSWWHRVNKPDLIVTIIMLAIFIAAFATAASWPSLAAYFPLGVSSAGTLSSAIFVIRVLFFPRKVDAPKTNIPEAATPVADQEYEFFRSLTLKDWVNSVGWLGSFFVFLAVFGIYVAMVVFTVCYLRFQAAKSWWFTAIYTATLVGTIYVTFELVLKLPLPGGLFGLA